MRVLPLTLLVLAACANGNRCDPYSNKPCGRQDIDPTVVPGESPRQTPRPVQRIEEVQTEHEVDGIAVESQPEGNVGWALTIENTTDEPMQVLWDESSFVGGEGHSWGRLLRGETRKIDSARPQPASPLPPHAKLTETVFPDGMLDFVGLPEYSLNDKINHGHLYVTVQTGSAQKKTWSGTVTVKGVSAPPVNDKDHEQ